MNIFSNVGITELILILLLALLVVGPERLPELARQLGKTLRDLRKAYDNLTKDLGPELLSMQQTTQELRESVESIRSIPQDMVQQVVKAADLDDTIEELKGVQASVEQVGQTLSDAGKVIKSPVGAAASAARSTLLPEKTTGQDKAKAVPREAPPAAEEEAAVPPAPDSVPPAESAGEGEVEQAPETEEPKAARVDEATDKPKEAIDSVAQMDEHSSSIEPETQRVGEAAVHPAQEPPAPTEPSQDEAPEQGSAPEGQQAAGSGPAEQAHE
jgi:sec-independent protein translocase protein TatB